MFCFFLVLPLRLRAVSVVFDFNASLNDVVPVFLMLLTIGLMRMEKGDSFLNIAYVWHSIFVFTL